MGRFLMLLAVLVQRAGIWQKLLFQINQIEESSKININAHTTCTQLHQRSITTASALLYAAQCEMCETPCNRTSRDSVHPVNFELFASETCLGTS